jgi:hypothetical protein
LLDPPLSDAFAHTEIGTSRTMIATIKTNPFLMQYSPLI